MATPSLRPWVFSLCMPLPQALSLHLEGLLTERQGRPTAVRDHNRVHGGSVNDAFRLVTDAGLYFLKTNSADQFPSLFTGEAHGLHLLQQSGELRVPEVIAQGECGDTTFLLLEFITPAQADEGFQARFGRKLARLHRHTQATFGLDRDNHFGLLPQVNTPAVDWPGFLTHNRFMPLVKMARDNKRIDVGDVLRFERLYGKLPSLFPAEAPALLHGDLWKNNFLTAADGEPVLIDPAVYFGHREMDLAMTRLFGGFFRDFYDAYQEERPLAPGWEGRVDLCNLYPLLAHLILFGGSYADRVGSVLRKYV